MAFTFNTSLSNVASKYIRLLGLKITETSVKTNIQENPNYPTLLSLSDVFDNYAIKNNAYQVEINKIEQVPPPYIAFVEIPKVGLDFILVTELIKNKIKYIYHKNKVQTVSVSDFLSQYRQVIWLAEPDKQIIEENYSEKLKAEKLIEAKNKFLKVSAILIAFIVFFGNITANNIASVISITLIKIFGIATTILLLNLELNNNDSFAQKICNMGRQTNCEAVLKSRGSTFAGFTWSEIGFLYFAFTTLTLQIPGLSFPQKFYWIALANMCATPYIFYSIYYQKFVIRKWCPLCLLVQFALFTEFLWSLANFWRYNPNFETSFYSILFVLTIFIFTIISWLAFKPILVKANNYNYYHYAYKRLQYNRSVFDSLLQHSPTIAPGWERLGIDLGAERSANILIKVCNPFCGPCAKAHFTLSNLLATKKNLTLKIIFATKSSENDPGFNIVRHLLALCDQGEIKIEKALNDWYLMDPKDYEKFANSHPIKTDLALQNDKVVDMSIWTKDAAIEGTPTFFINGYRLPENYGVEELSYIL